MNEIEALRRVNLDWAAQLSQVWRDADDDVPGLHAELRAEFANTLEAMKQDVSGGSPLGWIVVGEGGAGKTHLLGAFRREAARRKAAFVLVDMTDVRDFWETVLQGYIDSLQQPFEGGTLQYRCLLENIIERLGPNKPVGRILALLAGRKTTNLLSDIQKVLDALNKMHPREARRYHNVVRALICLNSADFGISSLGMTWLQGQALEEDDRARFGFTAAQETPKRIIEALSWFMGLSGPTILAFDQLDPIVTQLHYREAGTTSPEEQSVAKSIIVEIGGGLGALRDTARNTLTVVSCVETTWDILSGTVLKTFVDRFRPPRRLSAVRDEAIGRSIVENRLARAHGASGFEPAYPSWPFRPEAFEDARLDTPRELLKKCDLHRQRCLSTGAVKELARFGPGTREGTAAGDPGALQRLDQQFEQQKGECDPAVLVEPKHGDEKLAPLLQAALRCLLQETRLPDGVVGRVDCNFTGAAATWPLHARLRLIFEKESEREEHFCVRALEHDNARGYQARLKAAMTQAGIDRTLKFRHLALVRTRPAPGGTVTRKLTERFENAGGVFVSPTENELRTIHAVHQLGLSGDPAFSGWLRSRRPISQLSSIQLMVPSPWFSQEESEQRPLGRRRDDAAPLQDDTADDAAPLQDNAMDDGEDRSPVLEADGEDVSAGDWAAPPASRDADFPLGRALIAGKPGDVLTMPVALLEKHTVVLAGAGSGKTVLLRRLIEEAAMMGVPSIVIDCANDLAALGEEWPAPPDAWLPDDPDKARLYHQRSEVVIWTPGRENGNPLSLEPLPDLSAFAEGPEDELEGAVAMVRESLAPVVAAGRSTAASSKLGVLSRALRFLALHGGGRLAELIALLDDLPPNVGLGLADEPRLARQMADALKVAIETDPLLRSSGVPLDPAVLFGAGPGPCARISVISFTGLPAPGPQRTFLNQLAMALFGWIKKNPDPGPRPLRGLLVIDEARDFVPAQKSSACKESLVRLTAQARKYHLGIVFATQNPKDIDNKIVANCSTHYYGKVNSPAAIAVVKDLIREKGGSGEDVARLPHGQFYVHNADVHPAGPTKVQTSLCLSRHPDNPLDEADVLEKAVASRERRNGAGPPSRRER